MARVSNSPQPNLRSESSPLAAGPEWSSGSQGKQKHWSAYIPTFVTISCLTIPHISLFKILFSYYLVHLKAQKLFLLHLGGTYSLTFIAITCFLVVIVRDPGPVDGAKAQRVEDALMGYKGSGAGDYGSKAVHAEEGENVSLADLLNESNATSQKTNWSGNADRRWCQKCWSPKPERCHHCSDCGRCVLKMDHHCPWLANKCIGFRTYPAFLHLLLSVSCLCAYCFGLTIQPIMYYLSMSTSVLETDTTPWHTIFLALVSVIFGLCIGGFWIWHVYLVSTNQTTLESLTPFLILRHLPPPTSKRLSSLQHLDRSVPSPPSSLDSRVSFTSPTFASPSSPSTPIPQPATRYSQDSNSPFYFPPPPSAPPAQLTRTDSDDGTLLNLNAVARLQEHQLNSAQRRRVRYVAGKIRLYDMGGIVGNWSATILGGRTNRRRMGWRWWLGLIICGGRGEGNGYSFELNPKAERQLQRLADQLAEM